MCANKNAYATIFFALIFFPAFPALSEDIASCGSSSGYSYYADRSVTPKENVGWQEDKISKGKISLKQNSTGDLDILYADATGDIYSSVQEGDVIHPISFNNESLSLILIGKKYTESYVFQKLRDGKNQLMWTQTKGDVTFPKVSVFVADCAMLSLESFKVNSATSAPLR